MKPETVSGKPADITTSKLTPQIKERHFAARLLRFQMQDEKMMHSHAGLHVIILACKTEAQALANTRQIPDKCEMPKAQRRAARLTAEMSSDVGNLFKMTLVRKEKLSWSNFSNMKRNDLHHHPKHVLLTAAPIKGNLYKRN